MAMNAATVTALFVVLAVTMMSPQAQGFTCSQVTRSLVSCLTYLRGSGALSNSCCAGVKSLHGLDQTPTDRKTICNCINSAASSIGGINYVRAANLPKQCSFYIPYKISPSTDCSKVN